MANQILAGAVVQAGQVIAGVDANNPPVTESAPTSPTPATSVTDASFNAEASDGLAIVHNSRFDVFADWISYGTVGSYGQDSGTDRIVADGTDTGAVHYLRYDPISRRIWALVSWHPQGGGIGPTLVENGFGELTIDSSSEPFFNGYLYNNFTHTASIGSYFPGIIGSRLRYDPEDLAGLGITWDGTTWSKTVPAPAFPHSGEFTDNFAGVQKNVTVGWPYNIPMASGYGYDDLHEWIRYGESHPSTNTDPRIAYIRQDSDGYVYAIFTINNGQPLPDGSTSYTGIHNYYGFGVWNASNAVFQLFSARSVTEVASVGSYPQVVARTKVPYDLGLENFPAVWNEDVQGWVHTDWSA